jgi:hypothetical protein
MCTMWKESSLNIENVTPDSRLLGTESQDLTVSCKAEGGTPSPNIVLIIDCQLISENSKCMHYTFDYSCLL